MSYLQSNIEYILKKMTQTQMILSKNILRLSNQRYFVLRMGLQKIQDGRP
jgi:hypothetical protein